MAKEDDLKKRLEVLERENRALKEAVSRGAQKDKTIYCTLGEYKGHPTISFEGAGRPFSIGVKKAAVVLAATEHVRAFVSTHDALLKGYSVVRRAGGAIEPGNEDDSHI